VKPPPGGPSSSAAAIACTDPDGNGDDATPRGWDATALATAVRLADAIRAAGVPCDGYEVWDHAAITADYARMMPVPAAMARCSGPDGEDRDQDASPVHEGAGARTRVPGSALRRGRRWLVEPDEQAIAERLGPILGGTTKRDVCP
jgi:hypothetical protein